MGEHLNELIKFLNEVRLPHLRERGEFDRISEVEMIRDRLVQIATTDSCKTLDLGEAYCATVHFTSCYP